MSVSDEARRDLFDAFVSLLGRERAGVMMELLPPVGWNDVARRGDIAELRGEIAELRGEMRAEIAALRAEMTSLRGDLLPKLIAANIASMIGVAGLVLAAGALL